MKKKIKSHRPREILVVKVGSDEYPAGPEDLIKIQEDLLSCGKCKTITLTTHHAISFEKVTTSTKNKILVIKVGSPYRPSGVTDITAIRELFKQAYKDKTLTVVTHHAISFEYIEKVWFKKVKAMTTPFMAATLYGTVAPSSEPYRGESISSISSSSVVEDIAVEDETKPQTIFVIRNP